MTLSREEILERKREKHRLNREENNAKSRAYYQKNKERSKKYRRDNAERYKRYRWLATLRKHGLTEEDYEKLLESQKGRCAVCEKKQKKRLVNDHDHDTMKIRGLLCSECNLGIGKLGDGKLILKVVKYLKL